VQILEEKIFAYKEIIRKIKNKYNVTISKSSIYQILEKESKR